MPELIRKVRKHAPHRTCTSYHSPSCLSSPANASPQEHDALTLRLRTHTGLALAAETECAISQKTATGARPSAAETAQELDVSNRLPKLAAVIGAESTHHEDRFQAKVCRGWLCWVVGEYSDALETLPASLEGEGIAPERVDAISEWTNVCALRAGYLKANCLMRHDQRTDALAALKLASPSLEGVWCGHGVRKQLRYWSELFLTETCMLSSQAVDKEELSLDSPDSIAGFRAWARYWDVMGAPVTGGTGFKGSVPRRRIWSEYYDALSCILENDLPYATGQVHSVPSDLPPRAQLRLEIKQTENAYRALILSETTFPRADESRPELEDFVKRVMANWAILCGRGWREEDLGPGGRTALTRNVLETLYSAATRTFHSTSILRSLFSAHLAVAEFDLAFKAFDSYLEIVKKGKARVEKTGHEEVSLDDDGTVLETIAQAIVALCRYGHRLAGEKARQLGAELEDWLSKLPQARVAENGASPHVGDEIRNGSKTHVSPHIIALAWQAIGLSHAHWSRITHEAASRTEIQSKAIRCLRKSLAAEYGRSRDIQSFFSLALLLAERRELTAAIELVRAALLSNKGQEESYSLYHGSHWQERALIPVWHLLALLMSARQDYDMASRACEGATEQFKDSAILFGRSGSEVRADHAKSADTNGFTEAPTRGLIDDMEDSEKESVLEVKMTQLALVELVEGPDAAVNASSELLSLFSRMFGTVTTAPASTTDAPDSSPSPSTVPPKTPATIRSIRGSIFGGKADRSTVPNRDASNTSHASERPSRPATSNGPQPAAATVQAPALLVTGEGDVEAGTSTRGGATTHEKRSGSRQRNSLRKRDSSASRTRSITSTSSAIHQATVVDGEVFFTPSTETDQPDFFSNLNKVAPPRVASINRGKALSPLPPIMSAGAKPGESAELMADMTNGSRNLQPPIQFSQGKKETHRQMLLIKIWLTISGFYRRAGQADDGRAAVHEAQKLLASIESDVASSDPTKDAGWAQWRSIDDLWGDIWSEVRPFSVTVTCCIY